MTRLIRLLAVVLGCAGCGEAPSVSESVDMYAAPDAMEMHDEYDGPDVTVDFLPYADNHAWLEVRDFTRNRKPPIHEPDERILLRGPDGEANAMLLGYGQSEPIESAYIAVEDVEAVVRRVLAEGPIVSP